MEAISTKPLTNPQHTHSTQRFSNFNCIYVCVLGSGKGRTGYTQVEVRGQLAESRSLLSPCGSNSGIQFWCYPVNILPVLLSTFLFLSHPPSESLATNELLI